MQLDTLRLDSADCAFSRRVLVSNEHAYAVVDAVKVPDGTASGGKIQLTYRARSVANACRSYEAHFESIRQHVVHDGCSMRSTCK